MKRLQILMAMGMVVMLATVGWAAVPNLINFQGMLRNSSGNPVPNGSYSVEFKIYSAETGGVPLWSETQSVQVENGNLSVVLGSVNSTPDFLSVFSGPPYGLRWLGLAVNGESEMIPRSQLVSVPFALFAGSVDGAGGGTISSDVDVIG
ncbi:MAG: hypothetical protein ACRECJ_05275, partial [Limisphaerales bacterium]